MYAIFRHQKVSQTTFASFSVNVRTPPVLLVALAAASPPALSHALWNCRMSISKP